uniref:Uncharacterized protein n=1 Tax=Anguilla anguilla TaxID=7936 RepID=A0A0E9V0R0_ANGAN
MKAKKCLKWSSVATFFHYIRQQFKS